MTTFSDVYRIKNVGSGDYLALTSGTPKDPVACTPFKPDDNKWLWRIDKLANGSYKITNEEYKLQVDRPAGSLRIASNTEGYAFYIEGPETGRKIRSAAGGGTVLQHDKAKNQVLSAKDKADKSLEWIFEIAKSGGPGGETGGPGGETGGPGGETGGPRPEDDPPRPARHGDYPVKPGKYVIKNVHTGSVIDLEKCIPGDNVKIFGFGANGGLNQQWDIQPSATAPHMTLRCVATDKYASFANFNAGTSLLSSSAAQEFLIIPADRGYYISPVPGPGYVLDLTNGNVADETPITPVINHGRNHQKWHLIAV